MPILSAVVAWGRRSRMASFGHARLGRGRLESLERRQLFAAADPVISEIMAQNNAGISDEDGTKSDWIEINNPGTTPLDLGGYYLSDKKTQLTQWQFPAGVTIAPGGYLLVWASSKNRRVAGQPLHTNFALSASGEYLGLTKPDGTSVVSSFDPSFPEQTANVSYGTIPAQSTLVSQTGPHRAFVPTSNAVDTTWKSPTFNDASWLSGNAAVGFDGGTNVFAGVVGTNVQSAMLNTRTSAYVRYNFSVADAEAFDTLNLRVRYDDGFVAWLNGTRIASRNAPNSVNWTSSATTFQPDGVLHAFVDIDVSAFRSALLNGNNTLAIQGLNEKANSRDFLVQAELTSVDHTTTTRGFMNPATPGAANLAPTTQTVATPTFSAERGFHESAFALTLATATDGATIRYTTDGSAPTLNSGTVYTSPITINKSTVVRMAAFKTGFTSSRVETSTYLFKDSVLSQPATVPGVTNGIKDVGKNFTVPSDWAMDPAVVNNSAYATAIRNGLTAIPSISISTQASFMFGTAGFMESDLERGVSIELIDPSDPLNNSQVDGAAEGHSHDRLKRSIRLSFKAQYGTTKWRTDLLKNGPFNGDTASDALDSLVLRGGNNRSWARMWNPDATTYTEDEWFRATYLAMGQQGSHGTFVHVYLNGNYFGLFNVAERPDENFQAIYGGGSDDGYFSLNHDGRTRGDATRWNALTGNLIKQDLSVSANYAAVANYLDVENFADYMILAWFSGQTDWPLNNWYAGNTNGPTPGKVKFFSWDGEWTWDRSTSGTQNGAWVAPEFRNNSTSTAVIPSIWRALKTSPQFMDLFAARVAKHLGEGGALSESANLARFDKLNNTIRDAVVAESARWGDALESLGQPLRTRDVDWQRTVNTIRGIMVGNGARFIAALRAQGYFPPLNVPVFANGDEGATSGSFDAVLTNPNGAAGSIYYTIDGTDPRNADGTLSSSAMLYDGPITLTTSKTITARVKNGSTWSVAATHAFVVSPFANLRISELMYNPADATPPDTTDNDEFEFVELFNGGTTTLDLGGVTLAGGIDFTFTAGTTLAPGAYLVVVENAVAFASRYNGVTIAGEFGGKLSDDGERITLLTASGEVIESLDFSNAWVPDTNGGGRSLTAINPMAQPALLNSAANWKASADALGSPGRADVVAPPVPPTAPSGLQVTATAPRQVTVRWTDQSTDETGFAIERSIDGGLTFDLLEVVAANTTTYDDITAEPESSYVYRVRAVKLTLNSSWTNTVTATTPAAPLVAPTNLVLTDLEPFKVSLSWTDNSTDETGFLIERSTDGGVTFTLLASLDPSTTSYNDASVIPEQAYVYRVRAIRGAMQSTPTNNRSLTTPATLPAAPSGLIVTSTSLAQVSLSWVDHSNDETGFVIERSINGGSSFTDLATVGANVTSYADVNVGPSQSYVYRVRAIKNALSSTTSNAATATTPAAPPIAPSNLVASNVLTTRVELAWSDNSNDETGFVIERSTDGGTTFTLLTIADVNATNFEDTNVLPETTYVYRVRSVKESLTSGWSDTVTVTTPAIQPPAAPSDLIVTATTSTKVTLTWTDNSNDETGFVLERSTDGGTTFVSLATLDPNATSYEDLAVEPEHTYVYRVRSVREARQSDWSNTISATTPGVPVVVPPTLVSGTFAFQTSQAISLLFSADVGASIDLADLSIQNLSTGAFIPLSQFALSIDTSAGQPTRATWTHLSSFGALPDGNYRVTVLPGAITDAAGLAAATGVASDFYVLAGDFDRDRDVDFDDLLTLARNYGKAGQTFTDGNADYSADGVVSFDDLLLLAQRFGQSIAAPAPAAATTATATATAGRKRATASVIA